MINKKLLMIIGIILLAGGLTYAAGVVLFGGNSQGDISEGLILDMDLSSDNYVAGTKTFVDNSGQGNDGISNNSANFTTDMYGKSEGAMYFNGVSDFINGDGPIDIDDKNFTMSGWIWDNADTPNLWAGPLLIGSTFQEGRHLTSGRFITMNTSSVLISLSINAPVHQWNHLVVTHNINTKNLTAYLNGKQVSTQTYVGDLAPTNKKFAIGSRLQLGTSTLFRGSISEVKVWDRALSSAEVLTLYNSSKPKLSISSTYQSGLVGYWTLDNESYNIATNRTTDKTPYENYGITHGANFTTDRMGHSNSAMYFDGSNDFINCSNSSSLQITDNLSVFVWIKGTTPDNADSIISRWDTGANKRVWDIYGSSAGGVFGVQLSDDGTFNEGHIVQFLSNISVYDNTWHHIGFTFNTGDLRLYVDGAESIGTVNFNDSITFLSSNNTKLMIGANLINDALQRYSKVSLSDARVYNRALSAEEIATLYNSYNPKLSAGSLQKGLIFDMPLTSSWTKEGAVGSEIMTDKTPYSNDGRNYNTVIGSDYATFDGDGDYVDCSNSSSLNVDTGLTIAAWIKPASLNANTGDFVSKYQNGVGGYSFTRYTNDALIFVYSADNYLYANNVFEVDKWVHIVYTADNSVPGTSVLKSYVNGTYWSTITRYANINSTTNNLYVGGRGHYNAYTNGSISGIKIYNRALSADEIKLLYDKGM